MTQTVPTAAPVNPFSTRFVQPGAIPYSFPESVDAAALVERLRTSGWWGQIIGPHGSGKSTLLAALDLPLRTAGRTPLLITLHDGQRRLPISIAWRGELDETTLVIVDGYEQLSWLSRWLLKRRCRRNRWGLLVTSHESVGLPELFCTKTDFDTVRAIVDRLLAAHDTSVRAEDVTRAYDKNGGNVRDMLFDLYDLVEQRRYRRTGNRR